jgi:hypothetical protein
MKQGKRDVFQDIVDEMNGGRSYLESKRKEESERYRQTRRTSRIMGGLILTAVFGLCAAFYNPLWTDEAGARKALETAGYM